MRVEVGGGPAPTYPEFEQFDAIDWSERTGLRYTLGDARALPYKSGTVDHVYASNILEHFPPSETLPVLVEWARVLRTGGRLELIVPDSMGILRDHFAGINSWADCEERLRGSRDYPGNEHFAAFTLSDFAEVVGRVSALRLVLLEPSHAGGGIHATAVKRKV
jgi:predicted SAM-dependent methyltransferase